MLAHCNKVWPALHLQWLFTLQGRQHSALPPQVSTGRPPSWGSLFQGQPPAHRRCHWRQPLTANGTSRHPHANLQQQADQVSQSPVLGCSVSEVGHKLAPPSGLKCTFTILCVQDNKFMTAALDQAHLAAQQQEVPVGAVLVLNGQVVATAYNQTEQTGNPTAHAEMLCIQQAALKLGGWRLLDCTLYVTLEPCPMCAGALLQSRVGTVVYGARNTLLGDLQVWLLIISQQHS